ncbi:small ribosomal subunit protein uS14 isoform X2 [Macaca mulatta]
MGHQQLYWSHPRKFGQGSRSCRVCSNRHGLIRKYGLNMCRQCFRQYAKDIGFIKKRVSPYWSGWSRTLDLVIRPPLSVGITVGLNDLPSKHYPRSSTQ